jgi:hypothetical protein
MQTDGLSEAACARMSKYRGVYRKHAQLWGAKVEAYRSRSGCSYVESDAQLKKGFQAALERKRRELAEQREEIRKHAP